MKPLKLIRLVAWTAVFVLGGAAGTVFVQRQSEKPAIPTSMAIPKFGAPFTMVDHTGRTVTDRDFLGRPLAVFFGFTHCPDVCPTTLSWLSDLAEQVGPEGKDLTILFVSVDPERDTPEVLTGYVSNFAPNVVGLTGSVEQVASMTTAWKAFSKKVPLEDGGYTMDHTASVYLVDRSGAFRNILDVHDETPNANLSKLSRLVRGS